MNISTEQKQIEKITCISNKTSFNPNHFSSIFRENKKLKVKPKTSSNMTDKEFIMYMEHFLNYGENALFNQNQRNALQFKFHYTCLKMNVLDKLYLIMKDRKQSADVEAEETEEIEQLLMPYEYVYSVNNVLKKEFNVNDLYFFDRVEKGIDEIYAELKTCSNVYYSKAIWTHTNKYISKKGLKKKESSLESFKLNVFSKYNLPNITCKTDNKFNMFTFIKSYLKNEQPWENLFKKYAITHKEALPHKGFPDFYLQTAYYIDQIMTYCFFMNFLAEKYPSLNLENFQQDGYRHYSVCHEENISSNEIITYFDIKPIRFLEIDLFEKEITLSSVNLYIAFLEQMERYFFFELYYAFIQTLDYEHHKEKQK